MDWSATWGDLKAICRIHEGKSWIECAREAWEGDPEGFCILHSQRKDKDQNEAFSQAVRDQLAREDYNFSGVFFPGEFSFAKHAFSHSADFSWTTFKEKTDFSGVNFEKGVFFNGAIFEDRAFFEETIFMEKAIFNAATFSKYVNFIASIFKGLTRFAGATFLEGVNFTVVKIEGQLLFHGINPSREGNPAPVFHGGFFNLELEQGGVLRFQDLSLAMAIFQGSDLRRVEFNHVQWHPYRGRQTIYDEILLMNKFKEKVWFLNCPHTASTKSWPDRYGEVERLYRYVKFNYETQGDYKNAGDFHYGEMEMHRRASKWRWVPVYWYNLYCCFSGYGERPLRALMWLVIFLFGLGATVWRFGLYINGYGNFAGFWDSLVFILQKASLQRPEWPMPANFWARILSSLSVLLLPGQAALFILALRNRLGRRR